MKDSEDALDSLGVLDSSDALDLLGFVVHLRILGSLSLNFHQGFQLAKPQYCDSPKD